VTTKTTVLAIFALTYALIASRRFSLLPIGRPAGALLGAVLLVVVGAMTPAQTYAAIDHDTVVLLFGMMMLTAYLDLGGFFTWLTTTAVGLAGSPRRLLVGTAVLAAVLSAVLVNDTVCLFMTPVIVATCLRHRLPMGPYLIGLATSANIGSAATLVGNPQNMIVGSRSGLPFATYLALAAPAAAVALAVNVALLLAYYGRRLPVEFGDPAGGAAGETVEPDRVRLHLLSVVVVAILVGFFAGGHMGYVVLAAVAVVMVVDRREPTEVFARVDWSLLVFFCSLFIVMGAVGATGVVERCWLALLPHLDLTGGAGVAAFTLFTVAGSNLVSNVPLVLLVAPHMSTLAAPTLGWVLLAFVSTLAGNLTIVGSVANIIVAEGARKHYVIGFREYLRFGVLSTALTLAVGCPLLVLTVRLLQ